MSAAEKSAALRFLTNFPSDGVSLRHAATLWLGATHDGSARRFDSADDKSDVFTDHFDLADDPGNWWAGRSHEPVASALLEHLRRSPLDGRGDLARL